MQPHDMHKHTWVLEMPNEINFAIIRDPKIPKNTGIAQFFLITKMKKKHILLTISFIFQLYQNYMSIKLKYKKITK